MTDTIFLSPNKEVRLRSNTKAGIRAKQMRGRKREKQRDREERLTKANDTRESIFRNSKLP